MDHASSEFLQKRKEEFFAFRQALSKESDRGCALFAAAYLDSALSDLLFLSFVESKKIEDDLFEGNAPLSAFSSRIKMAFYLGRISAECRAVLEQLEVSGRLDDLRVPPGNRLEALAGDRTGQHSIRINDQWRVCFVWRDGGAHDVEIVDYH